MTTGERQTSKSLTEPLVASTGRGRGQAGFGWEDTFPDATAVRRRMNWLK